MRALEFHKPLAIVDVETTGSSPEYSRILEIAVIRVENGKVVETLNTVIDPECSIPASITLLTGIREDNIKSAPTFTSIADDAKRLLDGAIFVAHNAQFDYAFIKSEFKRLGQKFSAKRLCTVALSRKLFPKYSRHDLSSIISRCDFECESRHRALDDAKVLIDFLKYSHKKSGEEKYRQATDSILSRNSVPSSLPPQLIDSLPESSGVYIFYGENDEKLYIGKSVNIRKRILSHFTGIGTNKSVKLAQEVRDIEAIETHGELGALLLESELIKQEQPLYNRMLRHARKLVALEEYTDKAGYKRVKFSEHIAGDDIDYEKFLGLFKSVSQAKKILQEYAEEYELCQMLLGLENTKTCFASQIGKCRGACSHKENSDLYNARFDMAFAERRIKSWPYKSSIIIEEKSKEPGENAGTIFMIDNWKLIKSFTYDEEGNEKEFLSGSIKAFNYDTYKILARHILENPKKTKLFSPSAV